MILDIRSIEEVLRNNNLLGNQNSFFFGRSMPGIAMQGMLGPILTVTQVTDFIVCKADQNIIFIPCNKLTNAPIMEKKVVLPAQNITKIKLSKGNPGFIKTSFFEGDKISFEIQVGIVSINNPEFKGNYVNFISSFQNEGLEILNEKFVTNSRFNIMSYIFMIFLLAVGVWALIDGDLIVGIGGISAGIYLIYYLMKTKGKK